MRIEQAIRRDQKLLRVGGRGSEQRLQLALVANVDLGPADFVFEFDGEFTKIPRRRRRTAKPDGLTTPPPQTL